LFAIELLEQDGPPGESAGGRITVGDFVEEFEASLTFWGADDYRASWRAALSVLEAGSATSCLVSSLTDRLPVTSSSAGPSTATATTSMYRAL
jgi:CdiI N-terminal domain